MHRRVAQVNSTIQAQLSILIRREIEFPPAAVVTVTGVESSDDLSLVRVYVSTFPPAQEKEVIQILVRAKHHLVDALLRRIRMRKVPEFRFLSDTTEERAQHMEELLDTLKEHKTE